MQGGPWWHHESLTARTRLNGLHAGKPGKPNPSRGGYAQRPPLRLTIEDSPPARPARATRPARDPCTHQATRQVRTDLIKVRSMPGYSAAAASRRAGLVLCSRPTATSDRGRPAAERGYAWVVRRRSRLWPSPMPPVTTSSSPAPMTASHRIGEPGPCGAVPPNPVFTPPEPEFGHFVSA